MCAITSFRYLRRDLLVSHTIGQSDATGILPQLHLQLLFRFPMRMRRPRPPIRCPLRLRLREKKIPIISFTFYLFLVNVFSAVSKSAFKRYGGA